MLSPLQLATTAARLASATIDVDHRGPDLAVTADYRFRPAPDSVEFVVIRVAGAPRPVFVLDRGRVGEEAGLWRLVVAPDSAGTMRIRYTLAVSDRVPIPVPTVPTGGGERTVAVRLGRSDAFALGESFPRFVPSDRGAAAALANVPSLLQLPLRGSKPWLRRLELGLVAVLGAASLLWLALRRARAAP